MSLSKIKVIKRHIYHTNTKPEPTQSIHAHTSCFCVKVNSDSGTSSDCHSISSFFYHFYYARNTKQQAVAKGKTKKERIT